MSSANIKHSRKSASTEEKEKKRQSDSPAKEMMKKLAAKEKDKKDKETPKDKSSDKEEKNVEKQEKKQEKIAEKKEEKPKDDKGEKSGKTEKRPDNKPKHNGNPTKTVQNGVSDVTLNANDGNDDSMNGTVSADSDDDAAMVIDDHDQDELFPELTYDETSDNECFEPPTPENAPSRSFTRRSQTNQLTPPECMVKVKSTRTPETPRPTSDKQPADNQPAEDNPKDSKVLKLKDDTPASDRVLRSADSPKPESKKAQDAKKDKEDKDDDKQEEDKTQESEKTDQVIDISEEKEDIKEASDKSVQIIKEGGEENKETQGEVVNTVVVLIAGEDKEKETEDKWESHEVQVVVDVEGPEEGSRKTDTNYSKSRVKVSPYRRSMRLAEQAEVSTQANVSSMANYTGNNTTMEMDITETSFMSEEANPDSSGYLRGLRNIRGRSSYKPLKEYTFKHTANRSTRSANAAVSEQQSRPTGTVVGRKRKPDMDTGKEDPAERTNDATEYTYVAQKRMRILDRISMPFRRTATLPSMGHTRRTAEIVGINTDLPLTAPVVSSETFDPETLKAAPAVPTVQEPVATPLTTTERDAKKCVIV